MSFTPSNQITGFNKTHRSFELSIAQRLLCCAERTASMQSINDLIHGEFEPSLSGFAEWNTCLELGLI